MGNKRSRLSAVLARFLKLREGEDGDRSAANDIAPIVQFAVDLWGDPCLQEVGPDQIVQLKQAMPEIPTTEGLPADKRSLFQRWSIAKESNYSIVDANGKTIKLTRVSESTLRKRYRTGLNTFWKFLIDNGYALRTQSSEWAQPVYLSIARADYLYSVAYLRTQYDAGLKLATERGWLRDARIRDLRQLHAGRRRFLLSAWNKPTI